MHLVPEGNEAVVEAGVRIAGCRGTHYASVNVDVVGCVFGMKATLRDRSVRRNETCFS